jgi:hypothetical protein
VGAPVPMQRGDLRWHVTMPRDGSLPPQGLPGVIDWGTTAHPCTRLPDSGLRLVQLEIETPFARPLLAGDTGRDPLVRVSQSGSVARLTRLRALLTGAAAGTQIWLD